ncbi:LysR family transcriptional regulator [Pseudoduganella namucuonensis]|uniref:DNA-binding transcriptional regulator, LysR family n=1 Tax=Pseudoduganella namucuonensis TaxID=1035707 RepID=A0A1I7EU10_9BURK|nr:LysR family transcriptional regulator [Pseudoduganella namucuonensis]SFU27400.1 DNA-binding transcriptional regulator, LysR family [Pseudoduganella namucuonensis]
MNLTDLRIFVSAARRPTLGAVALEMHLTPSAVSKALKRLEDSLGAPLFDRSARQLVLNQRGALLLSRARTLLALADQTRADLLGEHAALDCRVGGPAVLLWRHGGDMASALRRYPEASLHWQGMFEGEALAALARGEIDAAIVTGEVAEGRGEHWSEEWTATHLGDMVQHLAAGRTHPLVTALAGQADGRDGALPDALPGAAPHVPLSATLAQVLAHDFACPSHSLFCGARRGARSDGWRDEHLPRKIRYWADDLQLLLHFVKSGQALAYLPDFALAEGDLARIVVTDSAYACGERVVLVWNHVRAPAWLRGLAQALAHA